MYSLGLLFFAKVGMHIGHSDVATGRQSIATLPSNGQDDVVLGALLFIRRARAIGDGVPAGTFEYLR